MSRRVRTQLTLGLLTLAACAKAGDAPPPAGGEPDRAAPQAAAPQAEPTAAAEPAAAAAAAPAAGAPAAEAIAPPADAPARVIFRSGNGEVIFDVEIADTPSERDRGLKHRKSLAPDRGMIYVFTEERGHAFWMDGTLIPLDLVFLNKAGEVVGVIADASPNSADHLTIDAPSLYVLEVNGGLAAKHGITRGSRATLVGVPERAGL